MADLHHAIEIQASPEKVYQAIATDEGLRSWWTADSKTDSKVGGSAEFGFDNRGTIFRMRIEELRPGARVAWSCVGDPDDWKGTRLTWELSKTDDGTMLRFTHGHWRSAEGYFALCNSTWGELMYRLKDAVEGKRPGPRWTQSAPSVDVRASPSGIPRRMDRAHTSPSQHAEAGITEICGKIDVRIARPSRARAANGCRRRPERRKG